MKPYVLGAIFARGGSRGLPCKNIKELAGKPLIAYAIEVGRAVSLIDKLIVSTDDEEIAAIAQRYGAEVPFRRPAQLSTDDASVLLAWRHAVETIEKQTGNKVDVLVSIPPTSPLRAVEDVQACIERLLNSDADIVITVKEAGRNPYFNMVTLDDEDNAQLVIQSQTIINRRQDAPLVYDMTTVAYAARASYVCQMSSLFAGKVKAVIVPAYRALDIDTSLDLEIAEFLIRKKERN